MGIIKYSGSKNMLIMNNECSVEVAESVVRERTVDLVAFGKPFIYKPVCFIL